MDSAFQKGKEDGKFRRDCGAVQADDLSSHSFVKYL